MASSPSPETSLHSAWTHPFSRKPSCTLHGFTGILRNRPAQRMASPELTKSVLRSAWSYPVTVKVLRLPVGIVRFRKRKIVQKYKTESTSVSQWLISGMFCRNLAGFYLWTSVISLLSTVYFRPSKFMGKTILIFTGIPDCSPGLKFGKMLTSLLASVSQDSLRPLMTLMLVIVPSFSTMNWTNTLPTMVSCPTLQLLFCLINVYKES